MKDNLNDNKEENPQGGNNAKDGMKRRVLLKAFVGLPVVGALGFEILKKHNYDLEMLSGVAKELGLDTVDSSISDYGSKKWAGELIRIGFIGFGVRGTQLAKGLGFIHPENVKTNQQRNKLNDWFCQEYLNVAITGICDVFDLHAEKGLETAQNKIRPGGENAPDLHIKRYLTYQEMLADKDIDAVIIATPDHHHAPISIAAAKAGKHVYCEKSVALNEDDLNRLYKTVKESGIVFQLGHQLPQNTVFKQAKGIIKKDILGKITLVETTSNRNTPSGAWVRHLDANGGLKPGSEKDIDWEQWLGPAPRVPFSLERYYNWTQYFDYDTGMIGQLFTHEYDAVNQLLRMDIPKTVFSSGGIYYWKDGRDMADSLHCVFEYPDRDMTLVYSGNLQSGRDRGRVFMGDDASMELGGSAIVTVDRNSKRYAKGIKSGLINTDSPMISFNSESGQIDGVSSASEKYYASRGLSATTINGRQVDVTHLHLREWLDCIRNGGITSANIEMAYVEGVTCLMAQRSYVEKRMVRWDTDKRKIV